MKSVDSLLQDISKAEVVTLACGEPRIKPAMMSSIVKGCMALKWQVSYIDYDLQFSSLLHNLAREEREFREQDEILQVIQPADSEIIDSAALLASESMRHGGLIILDSINTVQNLLSIHPSPADLKAANHRSAVLINAYQQLARHYSKTIVILNLTKSRPRASEDGTLSWEREVIGGRMTAFLSDVILVSNEVYSRPGVLPKIKISVGAIPGSGFGGKVSDDYELS